MGPAGKARLGAGLVVLLPGGTIYVVWQDTRSGGSDIYFAKSANGGASFLPDVRVEDAARGPCVAPGAVMPMRDREGIW